MQGLAHDGKRQSKPDIPNKIRRRRCVAGVAMTGLLAMAALVISAVPGGATSTVTVTPTLLVAGATTSYNIHFTETNAIAAGDSVTLGAPAGTTLSAIASDYFIVNALSQYVPFTQATLSNSNATVTLTVPTGVSLAANASSTILANNVVNPGVGGYGNTNGLFLSTTQNTTAVDNASSYVIASGTVSTVSCGSGSAGLASAVNTLELHTGGTILLASGCTYVFTLGYSGGSEAFPTITQPVTIIGNGATLQGTGPVNPGAANSFGFFSNNASDLTLDNLTIEDAYQTSGGSAISSANGAVSVDNDTFDHDHSASNGGVIANVGSSGMGAVGVYNSTFSDNVGNNGGAISNAASASTTGTGFLAIANSSFTGNSSQLFGGAIDNGDNGGTGNATITNSTFASNTTTYGGAILNSGTGGASATLTITNSTFDANSATANGGAIENDLGHNGALTISNSTFDANSAAGTGGAIQNNTVTGNGTASVAATSSTFVGNTDSSGSDAIHNTAGGIAANVTVAGDLFAGACSSSSGTWTDNGYNVDTVASCLNGGSHDVSNSAAVGSDLGTLANNGGLTQTIEPTTGNPAIGVIPNSTTGLCPTIDQRGRASVGACDAGSVQLAATSVALTSSLNPATTGQSVTFTATVSGSNPTGTVVFDDGASPIGSGSISSGVATYATSALSAGSHTISAIYGGDINNTASQSSNLSQTSQAATSVTLSSSLNPATTGQSVTFTATVSGSSPTGTVVFDDGGSPIGSGSISSGVVTFAVSALAAGSHTISAAYSGDANNATSQSSNLTQVVIAPPAPPAPPPPPSLPSDPAPPLASTSVLLFSSFNPAVVGQSVTFTAVVSGQSPSGTVAFDNGTNQIGVATLSNGIATFTLPLSAGTYQIAAIYEGDNNNNVGLSAQLVQMVSASTSSTTPPTTTPTTPSTIPTIPASPSSPGVKVAKAKPLLIVSTALLALSKSKVGAVSLSCEHANCTGKIELKSGSIVLASASYSLRKAAKKIVGLAVSAAGKSTLAKASAKAPLHETLIGSVHGGRTVTKKVTVS